VRQSWWNSNEYAQWWDGQQSEYMNNVSNRDMWNEATAAQQQSMRDAFSENFSPDPDADSPTPEDIFLEDATIERQDELFREATDAPEDLKRWEDAVKAEHTGEREKVFRDIVEVEEGDLDRPQKETLQERRDEWRNDQIDRVSGKDIVEWVSEQGRGDAYDEYQAVRDRMLENFEEDQSSESDAFDDWRGENSEAKTALSIVVRGGGVNKMERSIQLDDAGKPYISNDYFNVQEDARNKGLGASVLWDEVRAAQALGIDRIRTTAAGSGRDLASDPTSFNGFYTWPRLGYEATIPSSLSLPTDISELMKGSRSVQDLFAIPGGRQWWKGNGTGLSATFDTRPGSRSFKLLSEYMATRPRQKPIATSAGGPRRYDEDAPPIPGPNGYIPPALRKYEESELLSEEDEKILDQIQIRRKGQHDTDPSETFASTNKSLIELLHGMAGKSENALAEAFLAALAAVQQSASADDIAKMIADMGSRRPTGADVDDVLEALNWSKLGAPAVRAGAEAVVADVVGKAGALTAKEVRGLPGVEGAVDFSFNMKHPRAQKWIAEHGADLVKGITEAQKEAIRSILSRAWDEGIHPYQQAQQIRDNIGLLHNQESALDDLRVSLEDEGLDDNEIKRQVSSRREDMLDQRAEVIARHETIVAAYQGHREGWRQAVDEELIDPDIAVQQWSAATEDPKRTCPYCMWLDGKTAPLDEPFPDPPDYDGDPIFQPGDPHIQCRCGTAMRPYGVSGNPPEDGGGEESGIEPAERFYNPDQERDADGKWGDGGGDGGDGGDSDGDGPNPPWPPKMDASEFEKQSSSYESSLAAASRDAMKHEAGWLDGEEGRINAAQGTEFFYEKMSQDPAYFEKTMDDLRGAWIHIGGEGPNTFKLATQIAFGLSEGAIYDSKAGGFVKLGSLPAGEATVWAAAMRHEYEDTQKELSNPEGVEFESMPSKDAWNQSYEKLEWEGAQVEAAWSNLSDSDKAEYVNDKPGSYDKWAEDNFDAIVAYAKDEDGGAPPTPSGAWLESETRIPSEMREKLVEHGADPKELDRLDAVMEETNRAWMEAMSTQSAYEKTLEEKYGKDDSGATWRSIPILGSESEQVRLLDNAEESTRRAWGKARDAHTGEFLARVNLKESDLSDSDREKFDEKRQEFLDDYGKRAYVVSDGEEAAKDKYMSEDAYGADLDDQDAYADWAQRYKDRETITPDDWPKKLVRGVATDTTGYTKNYAESYTTTRDIARNFGSKIIEEAIDRRRILVFQGAKHWKARKGGFGYAEDEFIVLAGLPRWVNPKQGRLKFRRRVAA
jgi:hypothetical protein